MLTDMQRMLSLAGSIKSKVIPSSFNGLIFQHDPWILILWESETKTKSSDKSCSKDVHRVHSRPEKRLPAAVYDRPGPSWCPPLPGRCSPHPGPPPPRTAGAGSTESCDWSTSCPGHLSSSSRREALRRESASRCSEGGAALLLHIRLEEAKKVYPSVKRRGANLQKRLTNYLNKEVGEALALWLEIIVVKERSAEVPLCTTHGAVQGT